MMRRILTTLVVLVAFATSAAAATRPAYIVVDVDNGTVLANRSADQPWAPASTTKIMTAYVVFKALEAGEITLKSAVKISQNALNEPPSKMGFKVGTVLTVDNALKMLIVKSANDIAVAIAETVGGTEEAFIARMNAEAKRLGMNRTHYDNPNGLPDDAQWTTARDLAVIARATWEDFPQYREYFRIPAIRIGKRTLRSGNKLLEHFPGTIGMKTGYICDSGFNLVAVAKRDGRTLMSVVLGGATGSERNELAAQLLDRGFRYWTTPKARPALATFAATPTTRRPVSLREEICSAEARAARAAKAEADKDGPKPSALVPRFVLMDPVRVFTGGAAIPARNIPVPPRRPPQPGDAVAGGATARNDDAATAAVQ